MLKQVSPCPVCHGQKVIQHPAWAEYWKTHDISQTMEQINAWFGVNYGYASAPDEEIECGECDGTGQIESETDLREALAVIQAERENQELSIFFPTKKEG